VLRVLVEIDPLRKTLQPVEVGMSFGWSSIALARAYPNIRVEGI